MFLVAVLRAAADVNLVAFGDWGADTPAQQAVATAVAAYVEHNHIKLDAVLLLGDNFYVNIPGGVNDPQWKKLFEQMYDPTRLAVPFYACLGNHDYDDHREQGDAHSPPRPVDRPEVVLGYVCEARGADSGCGFEPSW